MPAKAGIHLQFRWQAKDDLDSGLRRNDERKIRLLRRVQNPSGAEGRSMFNLAIVIDFTRSNPYGELSSSVNGLLRGTKNMKASSVSIL